MPAEITVVGLGPGDPSHLTVESRALLAAGRVFLRTRVHPTLAALPESDGWPSFDDEYERAERFDDLYARIVGALLEEARREPLVYAVPGHPLVGEATVRLLLERAPAAGVAVRVRPAVSFVDVVLPALGLDPIADNAQIVDALELAAWLDREPFGGGSQPISPLRPALVAQLYAPAVASAAKLALQRLYPSETPAKLVVAAGTEAERVVEVPLHEIDHRPVDHLTTLYLPAVDPLACGRTAEALQRIVARLRAPGGCPWDREQTHASIKRHLIEEAYEAIDAIDRGDPEEMREELGDLLLQVYLHAQIAEEAEEFALEDVFESLTAKLVRRHPHVFGDVVAETAGAVLRNWEQIKQSERAAKGQPPAAQPLGNVPAALPALARAQTLIRRARRHGLPVAGTSPRARLLQAAGRRDLPTEEELGAALAALVDLAQDARIDAEEALRAWTIRFEDDARRRLTERLPSDAVSSVRDDAETAGEGDETE